MLIIDEYKSILRAKIADSELELAEVKRNRQLYEQLVLEHENICYQNDVIHGIKKHDTNKAYHKDKIYKMFKKIKFDPYDVSSLQNITPLNQHSDEVIMLFHYYKNFKKFALEEYTLVNRLINYSQLHFSDRLISYMFRSLLKFGAEYILETGKMLTLPHRVTLRLIGKDRRIVREKYGECKSGINWGESFECLKGIAKEDAPHIYEDFINRAITRKEFYKAMKPYTYNEELRPNAKKWLVRHTDDFFFWLTKSTRYSSIKLLRYYVVIPSSFVDPRVEWLYNIDRKQSAYREKMVNNVYDIIRTRHLGFLDKIAMLIKFDLQFCLDTYKNNIGT